jgi:hypothetical protein
MGTVKTVVVVLSAVLIGGCGGGGSDGSSEGACHLYLKNGTTACDIRTEDQCLPFPEVNQNVQSVNWVKGGSC